MTNHPFQTTNDIQILETICIEAGLILLHYYDQPDRQHITNKSDNSVVTEADISANKAIIRSLSSHYPTIPIVSEENSLSNNLNACKSGTYFMIDPLDGTSSFIKQSDEFTVNIAFIHNYTVLNGMIYCPVYKTLYYTNHSGQSIKKDCQTNQTKILNASTNSRQLRVIATKREPEKSKIIDELSHHQLTIADMVSISSSYKFCIMAEALPTYTQDEPILVHGTLPRPCHC